MNKKLTILFLLIWHFVYCQNKNFYLEYPNDKKLKEVYFIWEDNQFWQKEKYFYTKDLKIDKIETLNPFDIILYHKKYIYNPNNDLVEIIKLNNFEFAIEREKYEYFDDKYIVRTYDQFQNEIDLKEYDLKDRLIFHLTYKNTEPSHRYLYKYLYENPKDYDYYIYSSESNLEEKITYRFLENGNISEINNINYEENSFYNEVYLYDALNKISSITRYNKENKIIYKTLFEYKNQKLSSRISTGENNNFSDKFENFYDKKGNLIKTTKYTSEILNSKPKFDNETIYFYNSKNNLIRIENYNALSGNKKLYSIEYFDNERRLIKKTEYYLGKLSSEVFYKNGLESKQIRYEDEHKIFDIIKSEYDNQGNLILLTTTFADRTIKEKFSYEYEKTGAKKMIEYQK